MRFLLTVVWFVLFPVLGCGQPLRVAVAANAQAILKVLQTDFKKKTGIELDIVSGSSGKLTAQIKNGAPFDLFLSADMALPQNLYQAGFGLSKPQIYALGSLIVCSSSAVNLKDWPKLVKQPDVSKIALANPKLAPYGQAAEAALRKYQLWDAVQAKLVFGESIAQVNTYVTTGSVKIGFTSEALIYEKQNQNLNWVRVDRQLYPPIQQGVILLKHAQKKNYAQAQQFYSYLFSPDAQQLFRQHGYVIP